MDKVLAWLRFSKIDVLKASFSKKFLQINDIIVHSTHYLFSDWPKAHSEVSKSAPRTSSGCMSRILK